MQFGLTNYEENRSSYMIKIITVYLLHLMLLKVIPVLKHHASKVYEGVQVQL
jgi:hypothetical protein